MTPTFYDETNIRPDKYHRGLYTLHTSSCLCVGYGLLGPSMGLALTGRRKRRSNLLPADLSFTPVT